MFTHKEYQVQKEKPVVPPNQGIFALGSGNPLFVQGQPVNNNIFNQKPVGLNAFPGFQAQANPLADRAMSIYKTTLEDCNCPHYRFKVPANGCKHMVELHNLNRVAL